METYKTQKERVLEYMVRNGSITTDECFRNLHITRLAAAIYLLKQDGHKIEKTGVTRRHPDGHTQYYEVFRLRGQK